MKLKLDADEIEDLRAFLGAHPLGFAYGMIIDRPNENDSAEYIGIGVGSVLAQKPSTT